MTSANDLDTLRADIATALGWRHDPDQRGIDLWLAPNGKICRTPPELTTDTALALWRGVQWELSYLPTTTEHKPYTFIAFPESGAVGADGETPAEAVARAWLEYMKQEQEGER